MNQVSQQSDRQQMKTVFSITEGKGRTFWTKVGVGFVNRDGSITLKLDAIPINGALQVREWEPPREFGERKRSPSDALPVLPDRLPDPTRLDAIDKLF